MHRADRVAPSRTKPQHKAGGNRPFLLAETAGNPSATQPCTETAQPRARRPSRRQDASGILVGWMGHMANRCLHNWRVMGSVDRAGHAVEMRWVGRADDGEESAFLPANPQKAGLTSKEGANPVRLCRKWQSPGRHPPGEDTRDYAPQHLPVQPERAQLDGGDRRSWHSPGPNEVGGERMLR